MKAPIFRGWLLAATCAGLVFAASLNAEPAASGPWTKVPALPTACYYNGDPAVEKLQAAYDSISADHQRQNDINAQIRDDFNNVDPMEMARRMQENMMKDPQNAAKYMAQIQSTGAETQAEMPEINAKSLEFDEESKALMSRYEAALAQAYAPTNARWNALKKKLEIDPDSPGPSEMGTPDWAWTEWNIILNEWDKAYVANCAQWWAAGSPVHASMKRYKDWLVQERVPLEEKGDEAAKANYAMMDTPAGGYKSVAAMQAAEDYIRRAQRLFSYRLAEPRCPSGKCRW